VLTPLPATRYVGIHALTRKVSWDCLVSYEGSRYSVPWVYAGKRVWVRASQGIRLEAMAPSAGSKAISTAVVYLCTVEDVAYWWYALDSSGPYMCWSLGGRTCFKPIVSSSKSAVTFTR
jgi:hypothetical protein